MRMMKTGKPALFCNINLGAFNDSVVFYVSLYKIYLFLLVNSQKMASSPHEWFPTYLFAYIYA